MLFTVTNIKTLTGPQMKLWQANSGMFINADTLVFHAPDGLVATIVGHHDGPDGTPGPLVAEASEKEAEQWTALQARRTADFFEIQHQRRTHTDEGPTPSQHHEDLVTSLATKREIPTRQQLLDIAVQATNMVSEAKSASFGMVEITGSRMNWLGELCAIAGFLPKIPYKPGVTTGLEYVSSRKWPPLDNGTKVMTTQRKGTEKDEASHWQADAIKKRRWGVTGVIKHHHDSHGLSYEVTHDDGSVGFYNPEEFVVIQ